MLRVGAVFRVRVRFTLSVQWGGGGRQIPYPLVYVTSSRVLVVQMEVGIDDIKDMSACYAVVLMLITAMRY